MSSRVARWTLLLLPVFAGIGTWQWYDYRRHLREHEDDHDRLGQAILSTAVVAVHQACRGGRYDADELQAAIDEACTRIGGRTLVLVDSTGATLAESTVEDPADHPTTRFEQEFDVLRPRGGGRGRGGQRAVWEDLVGVAAGPLTIILDYPRSELDDRLAEDLLRFKLTSGALVLAVALLGVLLFLRWRSIELASRLEATSERMKALEYLGRLGAGLAHETRNPLGVVRGFAERLARGEMSEDEQRSAARSIVDEADRTVARLDEFMLLSRPADINRSRFAMRALFEELRGILGPDIEEKRISFTIEGKDFEVDADREQIRRLVLNLLLNAVQATEDDGNIRVALGRDGGGPTIRITDDGRGVPDEIRETLFEPYVSRREGGTGLGLSIARRIALEHGWILRHEAGDPRGTVMVVGVNRA